MMQTQYLKGQFLIAMPALENSFFDSALIYLIEHDEQGAFGLVVNKEMDISIGEVLAQFDSSFDENSDTSPIVNGGPVEPQRGFVLHRASNKQHWEGQLLMNNGISLTNSSDILEAKATGEDIGDYVIALGYSGWDAGQLEEEISDNAWLSINTSADEVLSLPVYERLNRCLKTLGINYQQLSDQTGHS